MVRHFLVRNAERERMVIAVSERAAAERFARWTGEEACEVRYGSASPTDVLGRCAACGRPILSSEPTLVMSAGQVHAECPIGRGE